MKKKEERDLDCLGIDNEHIECDKCSIKNQWMDFKESYKQGYAKCLVNVEKFMDEHRYTNSKNDICSIIRILNFEWEDFKKQEIAKLKEKK